MDDIFIEYGSLRLMVIDLEIVFIDHDIVYMGNTSWWRHNMTNMIDQEI